MGWETLYRQFERCHTKNRKRYLKQHIKYFYFRSKFLLDHSVLLVKRERERERATSATVDRVYLAEVKLGWGE